MSSTNKTTNYDLSQFIGTDKPAWLSDYNGDMGKIDAGIHSAQNTATGADGKATANASAIGTLSNLTTEAKTNLVAAVNEVNTSSATALNTATNAAGNANTAINTVNSLADYLSMSNINSIATSNIIPSSGTLGQTSVTVATNSDGTFGKVYGTIRHNAANTNTQIITLNVDTGIHPESDIVIVPAGISCKNQPGATNVAYFDQVEMTIKTTGKIEIKYWPGATGDNRIVLFPCVYFFSDFGDEPVNP